MENKISGDASAIGLWKNAAQAKAQCVISYLLFLGWELLDLHLHMQL